MRVFFAAVYEKGGPVIDVIDSATGLTAWRTAMQGFACFELKESERADRIGPLVNRMLNGILSRNPG